MSDPTAESIDAWLARSRELRRTDPVAARAAAESALEQAWTLVARVDSADVDDARARTRGARLELAILDCVQGHSERAIRRSQELITACERVGDERTIAVACNCAGTSYGALGDHVGAIEALEAGLAKWVRLCDRKMQAMTLSNVAIQHSLLGDEQTALSVYAEAEEVLPSEHELSLARLLVNASLSHRSLGDLPTARLKLERGLEIFQRCGGSFDVGNAWLERSVLRRLEGDFQGALEDLDRAVAAHQHWPDAHLAAAHQYRAETLLAGPVDETSVARARRELELGLALTPADGWSRPLAELHRLLADVHDQMGDLASALAHHRQYQRVDSALGRQLSERRVIAARLRSEIEAVRRLADHALAESQSLAATNSELELLVQDREELLGAAAHDLRSPLTAILMVGERLAGPGDVPADKVRDAGRLLEKLAGRMADQLAHVLEAGASTGRRRLNRERVDPIAVAELLKDAHHAAAASKSIALTFDVSGAPPALGDVSAVVDSVGNYVSNALKFAPRGSHVVVRCEWDPDEIRFIVDDDGPGLTADDERRAFTKYARLSARPTGGETSFGLGLSIVWHLAAAMNGRVWCCGRDVGGARFGLALPRSDGGRAASA